MFMFQAYFGLFVSLRRLWKGIIANCWHAELHLVFTLIIEITPCLFVSGQGLLERNVAICFCSHRQKHFPISLYSFANLAKFKTQQLHMQASAGLYLFCTEVLINNIHCNLNLLIIQLKFLLNALIHATAAESFDDLTYIQLYRCMAVPYVLINKTALHLECLLIMELKAITTVCVM